MYRRLKNIELKSQNFYIFSIIWGIISSCLILIFIKLGIRTQSIFSIKDLIIYLYAIISLNVWLYSKKRLDIGVLIIFFLFLLILNYLILNINYPAPLNNIRQIIAPVILLFIYSSIRLTEETAKKILNYLCYAVIAVFGFGLIEQIFQLWEKINLSEFFLLKNISVNEQGMSYMFYEPMFNNRERMTSFFLDPISLGHFYATVGGYLFYLKKNKKLKKIAFYLCVLGLFFCLSKGAILQFIICVFFFNRKIFLPIRVFSLFIPIFIIEIILKNFDISGVLLHLNGFVNSINTITFFGYGIGSSGNYTLMFAKKSELGIGDTYIGALIGQIGFVGALFWLSLCLFILHTISFSDKLAKNIAIKIFISIFVVSILSENTMNVTSFLLPSIVIGLCINTKSFNFI